MYFFGTFGFFVCIAWGLRRSRLTTRLNPQQGVGPTPLDPLLPYPATLRCYALSLKAPWPLTLPQLSPKPCEDAYVRCAFLRVACPKQCQEAYAPCAFLRGAWTKLRQEAYAPCAFHAALSCEAPNAANVDGRTWVGCGCCGASWLPAAACMTGTGTAGLGGAGAGDFVTANGGLVAGGPDLRPASHCASPAGFSGSVMVARRAFFTRSNNRAQTIFLCAALLITGHCITGIRNNCSARR